MDKVFLALCLKVNLCIPNFESCLYLITFSRTNCYGSCFFVRSRLVFGGGEGEVVWDWTKLLTSLVCRRNCARENNVI